MALSKRIVRAERCFSLSCCLQSGVCLGGVLIAFLCDLSELLSFLPAQFLDVQREGNIF